VLLLLFNQRFDLTHQIQSGRSISLWRSKKLIHVRTSGI